jgi:restriction system protein
MSHELAALIATNPKALDHVEWRDLERVMARIMEGLGFSVKLTPPSKDGGKDLILSCTAFRGYVSFIVELKHWRSGKRVGKSAVVSFLRVIIKEKRAGGVFISTSGYSPGAFEGLTEIERHTLRFGDGLKVGILARHYVRAASGLWIPPKNLPEVLFEATH